VAIVGTTYQLPYNTNKYMSFRKNIRYHQKYYNEINKLLEEKKSINILQYIGDKLIF